MVVGGGPAGLSAAIAAANCGASVVLVDRQDALGGQLVKQTHKFFGSERQRAGKRGIEIASLLAAQLTRLGGVEVLMGAEATGYYEDGVVTVDQEDVWRKFRPRALIVATGASEKMLAFPDNDLPGIYGAGAVQTLMNVYGVVPGERALVVGAGNIGLVVSYQLAQAGVNVLAVIEAAPVIGGYAVHASKIRRMGIPVLTGHSVKEARGSDCLLAATVWKLSRDWQGIPGTEITFDVDLMCLAVGLSPATELLWQAGCRMVFAPELGGYVPWHGAGQATTVPGVYVAGDSAGVEEASSAMLTGRIAGLSAARGLGFSVTGGEIEHAEAELSALRAGPTAEKIRRGLERLVAVGGAGTC
jgi:sarcosine oxidase subunit alpha